MSLVRDPPRVLIVEDDDFIASEYMGRFSAADVPFVGTKTLHDAIGAFRTHHVSIEVIVLDGIFPLNASAPRGMVHAGRDFARWLRDNRFEGTVIAASSDPRATSDIMAALGHRRCAAAGKGAPAVEAALKALGLERR